MSLRKILSGRRWLVWAAPPAPAAVRRPALMSSHLVLQRGGAAQLRPGRAGRTCPALNSHPLRLFKLLCSTAVPS